MITPKRTRTIKIRLSESELLQLRRICPEVHLAKWIRESCLGQHRTRKRRITRVDPELLRQLAAIGNNLNQIARAVNQDKWQPVDRIAVCVRLKGIEDELSKVREQG
jgi:hypothetical protein